MIKMSGLDRLKKRARDRKAERESRELIFSTGGREAGRQRERQWEMNVYARYLKAGARSGTELEEYLIRTCHARKLPEDSRRCSRMRDSMKTELIDRDAPWLLPRPARYPSDRNDAEKLKRYFDYLARREEKAREISHEEFPAEFSFYEIGIRVSETPSRARRLYTALKNRWTGQSSQPEGRKTGAVIRVGIEKKRQAVRAEASGERPALDKAGKMLWEIFSYYGVSEKDIRERSGRFRNLYRLSRLYGRTGPEWGVGTKKAAGQGERPEQKQDGQWE